MPTEPILSEREKRALYWENDVAPEVREHVITYRALDARRTALTRELIKVDEQSIRLFHILEREMA